jgi:hypothetical protein
VTVPSDRGNLGFAGWEELRQHVNALSDREPVEGGWRVEASMVHNPVPWSNGICTADMWDSGSDMLLLELGYRAAWRMQQETHDGEISRFLRAQLRLCETEGHKWVDAPTEGAWSEFARKYEFTRSCPRCGHTDGPNCRCHFCTKGHLRVAEESA